MTQLRALPYRHPTEVLADRCQWAIALLAEHIRAGRQDGWLEGDPTTLPEDISLAPITADRIARPRVSREATPLEWLAEQLGLGRAELETLWLLAAIEIDPRVSRLAQAFATPECPDLSVQLVRRMIMLTSSQLDQLVALHLVIVDTHATLPQHRRRIRAVDRVVDLARGEAGLDAAVARCASIMNGDVGSASSSITAAVQTARDALVVAIGPRGRGRATVLAASARASGHPTLRVRTSDLSVTPAELTGQLDAIGREAALLGLVPMFVELDERPDVVAALDRARPAFRGPLMATASAPIRCASRRVITHRIEKLARGDQAAVWIGILGTDNTACLDQVRGYDLPPGLIVAVATSALSSVGGDAARVTSELIRDSLRAQLEKALGSVASLVETTHTWADVVLPNEEFDQLLELRARAVRREQVLGEWGFGQRVGNGGGVAALLSGPPGTGKTMVAGLLAKELGLDLYQVDLSKIVSKYIGETEKQLATLFDLAETGHAMILFDEADSLFGKRTTVKSSNDRYANQETNYLLQRLEAFTGVCVLTTNHDAAIDDAFRRRLAMHIRFEMPEISQRRELWRSMLPATAPQDADLDYDALAHEFELGGGHIKNAALRAAFRAAEAGTPITTSELRRAAILEYESLGRVTIRQRA